MKCQYCERSSEEIPLISFVYKEQDYYVCTAHLPMLLHKPELFADKLPDSEEWAAGEHLHHDHD
ncbi:MAG TPA: hypothetical protein VJ965_05265 [Anaerolineales bacterium]|nr:hypothetical protein [Anaerolineales bacterium]